jgi:hypothetical protein
MASHEIDRSTPGNLERPTPELTDAYDAANEAISVRRVTRLVDHLLIPRLIGRVVRRACPLRIAGITNIAQATRHHAWNPLRPVALLLTS